MAAISGVDPFILQADGKGWLFAPAGLVDGPLPAHYEPQESPFTNPLYGQQRNPVREIIRHPREPAPAVRPRTRRRRVPLRRHHLPAHRAPHRGRHVPHAALPVRAAAGVLLRGLARAGAPSGAWRTAGWATIVTARTAVEARVLVTERIRTIEVQGRRLHQIGLPYHWGANGLSHRRLRQRPGPPGPRPERAHPGGQGAGLRHPAGPPAARARAAPAGARVRRTGGHHRRHRHGGVTDEHRPGRPRRPPRPSAADGLLHRHLGLHRVQGLRGGLQGVERGARGRAQPVRMSYDNTVGLGASTWRHVAFIEQPAGRTAGAASPTGIRWLMSSDVCKHCTESACLDVCPTGALFRTEFGTVVVQDDVCNGCGYCVPACPFGVIARREEDGQAHKCTLCYDRLGAGLEPACAKACPTSRSSSARWTSCASGPGSGSRTCTRPARTRPGCTWTTRRTGSAAAGRSSCCWTSPRCTACRRTRWSPPGTCPACGSTSPSPRPGWPAPAVALGLGRRR